MGKLNTLQSNSEQVSNGTVQLKDCPTEEMVADCLLKASAVNNFASYEKGCSYSII